MKSTEWEVVKKILDNMDVCDILDFIMDIASEYLSADEIAILCVNLGELANMKERDPEAKW